MLPKCVTFPHVSINIHLFIYEIEKSILELYVQFNIAWGWFH